MGIKFGQFISLLILVLSCSTYKTKSTDSNNTNAVDIDVKVEKLKDSLISITDTILILKYGCSECIYESGVRKAYVIWKQNEITKIIDINRINLTFSNLDVSQNDFWGYYFRNKENIINQPLKKPNFIDGGLYVSIFLYVKNDLEFKQEKITETYRTVSNENKNLLIWIYVMESIISQPLIYIYQVGNPDSVTSPKN